MYQKYDLKEFMASRRKRRIAAAIAMFVIMPLTIALWVWKGGGAKGKDYMLISFLLLLYMMVPFFMLFEHRKPRAREVVLLAMMTALTAAAHIFFHVTVPINAGTAMVVITGISLGPEAGFLTGAMARFISNFYQGQGAWTPWQMFCWGVMGFLAGICFNKVELRKNVFDRKREEAEAIAKGEKIHAPLETKASRSFKIIIGPLMFIALAEALAYIIYLIYPGDDKTFIGWRLYVFGAIGLLAGTLVQRKRLPVDGFTMAFFTFFTYFIIYGGIMNIAGMITTAAMSGGRPASLETLRALYITGAPYDLLNAVEAAAIVFFFGEAMIQKAERVKV